MGVPRLLVRNSMFHFHVSGAAEGMPVTVWELQELCRGGMGVAGAAGGVGAAGGTAPSLF